MTSYNSKNVSHWKNRIVRFFVGHSSVKRIRANGEWVQILNKEGVRKQLNSTLLSNPKDDINISPIVDVKVQINKRSLNSFKRIKSSSKLYRLWRSRMNINLNCLIIRIWSTPKQIMIIRSIVLDAQTFINAFEVNHIEVLVTRTYEAFFFVRTQRWATCGTLSTRSIQFVLIICAYFASITCCIQIWDFARTLEAIRAISPANSAVIITF